MFTVCLADRTLDALVTTCFIKFKLAISSYFILALPHVKILTFYCLFVFFPAAIFVVTFLLLGFNLSIALIVTFTVAVIIVDLLGLMYIWNISLNAVSLVNLVMVGCEYLRLRSFLGIALCILTVHNFMRLALAELIKNGGLLFMAGAHQRGRSSYSRTRVW